MAMMWKLFSAASTRSLSKIIIQPFQTIQVIVGGCSNPVKGTVQPKIQNTCFSSSLNFFHQLNCFSVNCQVLETSLKFNRSSCLLPEIMFRLLKIIQEKNMIPTGNCSQRLWIIFRNKIRISGERRYGWVCRHLQNSGAHTKTYPDGWRSLQARGKICFWWTVPLTHCMWASWDAASSPCGSCMIPTLTPDKRSPKAFSLME